jgi:hypothetical protein
MQLSARYWGIFAFPQFVGNTPEHPGAFATLISIGIAVAAAVIRLSRWLCLLAA